MCDIDNAQMITHLRLAVLSSNHLQLHMHSIDREPSNGRGPTHTILSVLYEFELPERTQIDNRMRPGTRTWLFIHLWLYAKYLFRRRSVAALAAALAGRLSRRRTITKRN